MTNYCKGPNLLFIYFRHLTNLIPHCHPTQPRMLFQDHFSWLNSLQLEWGVWIGFWLDGFGLRKACTDCGFLRQIERTNLDCESEINTGIHIYQSTFELFHFRFQIMWLRFWIWTKTFWQIDGFGEKRHGSADLHTLIHPICRIKARAVNRPPAWTGQKFMTRWVQKKECSKGNESAYWLAPLTNFFLS